MSRRAAPAAAFALALLLGCGDDPAPQPAAPPPASTARAEPAQRPSAPTLRIRRQPDGTLRVRTERAPRGDVLRELARVAGFDLAGSPPHRTLDLELASAGVEDVLAAALADVPHHLHYDPGHGGHGESELVRVTVGALPGTRSAPAESRKAEPMRSAAEPSRGAGDEEPERLSREPAGGERLEGEPGELFAAVGEAPDPATRAAAARALGDIEGGEDAFRAAQALARALGDRDPEVVAAAIGALEEVHDLIPDPAHVAAVKKLRDHADPRVRSAAAAFLEWTDDER